MLDYREVLTSVLDVAREAGALLRDGLERPGQARRFDALAEAFIRQRLNQLSEWGTNSDEGGYLPGKDRSHLWLIDPNDGTFFYNLGVRGSAVSIAALRDGIPVLGVVYAFAFPDHSGDLIAWAEGGPIQRNGQVVSQCLHDVSLDEPNLWFDSHLIVFLSPGADQYPDQATSMVAPARYVTVPSIAYRLALVAVGEGIGTVSLNSPCSWDYAAGHAILRGAGGVFVDQNGYPIRYSHDGYSTCDHCFAGGKQTVASLRRRPWTAPASKKSSELTHSRIHRVVWTERSEGKVIRDADQLSRAQGCLLGQIIGDALGGLVEFQSADAIRRRYPEGCRDLRDGGTWSNLAGQPTDDSELALLLARSLATLGKYDEASVLDAYVEWWNDPETFDRGNTIRQALAAAALAKTPELRLQAVRQNASAQSQSNGSLMRLARWACSPAAILRELLPWLAGMLP